MGKKQHLHACWLLVHNNREIISRWKESEADASRESQDKKNRNPVQDQEESLTICKEADYRGKQHSQQRQSLWGTFPLCRLHRDYWQIRRWKKLLIRWIIISAGLSDHILHQTWSTVTDISNIWTLKDKEQDSLMKSSINKRQIQS